MEIPTHTEAPHPIAAAKQLRIGAVANQLVALTPEVEHQPPLMLEDPLLLLKLTLTLLIHHLNCFIPFSRLLL
jgi:hypothetical protein